MKIKVDYSEECKMTEIDNVKIKTYELRTEL